MGLNSRASVGPDTQSLGVASMPIKNRKTNQKQTKQPQNQTKTNRLRADCHALEGYEICHVLGNCLVLSAAEQYFSGYPPELSVHLNEH